MLGQLDKMTFTRLEILLIFYPQFLTVLLSPSQQDSSGPWDLRVIGLMSDNSVISEAMAIWNQQPWLPLYPCSYCILQLFFGGLCGHGGHQPASMTPEFKYDLRFETCNLAYPGNYVHFAILVASGAMAASQWGQRSHLATKLNSRTSISYVAMLLWMALYQEVPQEEAKCDPLICCCSRVAELRSQVKIISCGVNFTTLMVKR